MANISKITLPNLDSYDLKDATARDLLNGHSVGVDVPSNAKFTDTTYESKAAASGGTDVSLVTTGEKYTWNAKTSNTGTVTKVSTGVGLTGGDVTTTGTVKAKLRSETALTLDSAAATTTTDRVYPVAVDKSGYLAVNVPWTDTNTQTITGVKGNSESSYRTGNVNLTAANIGAAASSHQHAPTDIVQGNAQKTGDLDPLTQAMVGSAASNKSFNLPPSAITIEYSTDGGSTWTDYGATDTAKKALFSETRTSSFYLGKATAKANNTVNNRLRVTIEPTDRYTSFNGLYVWMSTQGNTVKVDLERSTIGAKNTFSTVFTDQTLSGWSGNNIRYFSYGQFGGGSTQTSNNYKYRLTFKQTAINSNYPSAQIIDIRFFGVNVWSSPNNMVSLNHLYKWDENLNATFPAKVTATSFNGYTIESNVPANAQFTDTNTHRPVQVNGTQILGDNTTALNLTAGNSVSITNSSGTVSIGLDYDVIYSY